MKTISYPSIIIAAALSLFAKPAHAQTTQALAGIYRGTSVATLPNGERVTANVTITLKPHGREIVVAEVNGQTSTSDGNYHFVSDDVILGSFPSSEYTAFVARNGSGLTLTVLAKESGGEFVSEVTTLSLVEKL
jgi:hypothetical protein